MAAHLAGKVAGGALARARRALAIPPEISGCDILEAKLPG